MGVGDEQTNLIWRTPCRWKGGMVVSDGRLGPGRARHVS